MKRCVCGGWYSKGYRVMPKLLTLWASWVVLGWSVGWIQSVGLVLACRAKVAWAWSQCSGQLPPLSHNHIFLTCGEFHGPDLILLTYHLLQHTCYSTLFGSHWLRTWVLIYWNWNNAFSNLVMPPLGWIYPSCLQVELPSELMLNLFAVWWLFSRW